MMRFVILFFLLCISLLGDAFRVVKLDIKGAIGPASSQYLAQGISYAKERGADAVLIELDTPGGLSESMRDMIQDIANSPIPVVTYVYPKGARAASAGTYILYASHIAAMSPGTNLGAATPVSIMPAQNRNDANDTRLSALEKKAINDAAAYIKSLAQMNDRNISWALLAVYESKSLSATEALKYGVIDIVAQDTRELLKKLDGRSVTVSGKSVAFKTEGASVESFEADWKIKMLSTLTNPNIAYMFIIIAIYGIFFELMNPGSIFPGVIGAISGVIALYALNLLPFSYAGLLLILLGIAFMIAEVFVSGFGILGIGGAAAFAFGSVLLFDADTLGAGVSTPLIAAFSISSLAFFIFVMRLFLSSRYAKVQSGAEEMIGSAGEVLEAVGKEYLVRSHGEIWRAKSDKALSVGEKVEVLRVEGLVLMVKSTKE